MSQHFSQPCSENRDDDVDQDTEKQEATIKASIKRQQRYREKQRQYVDRLEETVKRLRMEVDERLTARHSAYKVRIQEYMSGMPLQSSTVQATSIISCMRECIIAFESGNQEQQANFLDLAACSDVRYGDQIGRTFVLQHWAYFAHLFCSFMLKKCNYIVECQDQYVNVGRVSALLVIRLRRHLWTSIFPHTILNERLRTRMVQKSTLRLPITFIFYFDGLGKVCRYAPTIDFVTGLYMVVQNYGDVACLLETAKIDAAGRILEELLPFDTYQVDSDFCGDHCSHNRFQTSPGCRNFTATHKFAMSFLLSSDTEEQS
ncbi:uncharacterized protein PHALS_11959 [Plasmopara halstedii]|uniref:BZIP domain-containing protein n=1 Tax=Plasmopara halstedii TaxID=4781 RepID=A0A0P1AL83_PLAHL|nr:uncharacterized protein PHALS_11959 [Plasmopara halstedii]CEG41626.1 hypothetical protein PHALS_11959 [Plasmopara halstedii]|eukprot:XP_024577995.1 hypothetical protein PHALS_11959 [Plasmopara halstedii]